MVNERRKGKQKIDKTVKYYTTIKERKKKTLHIFIPAMVNQIKSKEETKRPVAKQAKS